MKKVSIKDIDSLGLEKLSRDCMKSIVGGTVTQCGIQASGAFCPNGR